MGQKIPDVYTTSIEMNMDNKSEIFTLNINDL